MFARVRRLAEHRHASFWIGLAATVLILPSVTAGRAIDDYLHALILKGSTAFPGFVRHPLDLFRFAGPEYNRLSMEDGILPWWADPDVRFAFFRPLSALTHAIDHALWPDDAVLMHFHQVLWHVLMLFGAWVAYREIMAPRWIAVIAFALYALDDARGTPVAWLANRNAIIGFAVSVWALIEYHRARRGDSRRAAWLSPMAFAIAMLAGEGAVSILAYLGSYALFVDEGSWKQRFGRLAPHVGVLAAWAVLSKSLGYGVANSGIYFDPIGDSLLFLQNLPLRMLVLLFAQLGGPWSEMWNIYSFTFPIMPTIVVVGGLLTIAIFAYLLSPLLRTNAAVRFWATGAILSLVPACAAFPADRMLPWVSLGAMGTLAEFLGAYVDRRDDLWGGALARRLSSATTWTIIGLYLGVSMLLLPARSRSIADINVMLGRGYNTTPATRDLPTKTLVYINPPFDPYPCFMPFTREVLGIPRPKTQRWLATGITAVMVERLDARTLRVTPDGGFLLTDSEKLLRSPNRPFRQGDHVQLSDLDIEISRVTEDSRPAEAIFRFAIPLEDPSLVWLVWRDVGYEPFEIPAAGARVRVPAVNMLRILLGPDDPIGKALAG